MPDCEGGKGGAWLCSRSAASSCWAVVRLQLQLQLQQWTYCVCGWLRRTCALALEQRLCLREKEKTREGQASVCAAEGRVATNGYVHRTQRRVSCAHCSRPLPCIDGACMQFRVVVCVDSSC
jgi:hypothetical protein